MNKKIDYNITKSLRESQFKDFCQFFDNNDLEEFHIKEDGLEISLKSISSNTSTSSSNGKNQQNQSLSSVETSRSSEKKETEDVKSGQVVTAPISGIFYAASSPETSNYVEVNSQVKKGDKLCIIEAMKVMNEIESPYSGKVVSILVENNQPIKQGQEIMIIK